MNETYEEMTDERLASLAKESGRGNEKPLEELIKRYKNTVNAIARRYFLNGGDTDGLIQEGMIGVFKAVLSYDGKSEFRPYAVKCIKSCALSAIRKSERNKNIPLNKYISLSVGDGDDADKKEVLRGDSMNPEDSVVNSESEKEFLDLIKDSLSKYEYRVLSLYLQGFSYSDIAEKTGKKDVKSVDNAVQRIRNKLHNATNQLKNADNA